MENNLNNPEETTHRNNSSTVIDNFSNDPSNDTTVENHDISQFDTKYSNNIEENASQDDAHKAAAKKDILVGGLWLFGGLAVTFISYQAASGGGRYVMAWGAVIFGGYQFFKGIVNYSK